MRLRPLHALLALALAWGGCSGYTPTVPWPSQPPAPPPPVGPVEPQPPTDPPPVVDGLPAIGTPKATVVAAWGAGSDLPENPGEDDSVSYTRTIDGREAEIHVIYREGKVFRVVVTALVGGG